MSTKSKVLEILENNRGIAVSGGKLAMQLQLSRNAIWKVVKELQREGYDIEAIPNRGYRFGNGNDILSTAGIKPYLEKESMAENILVYSTLLSTSHTAKQLALEGAKHGTIIIANEQTGGRGRMGRSFFSPKDGGLYMSLILRPEISLDSSTLITSAAAVAVCRTLEKTTGVKAGIKWVNDIYCNGKKICGILTEAIMDFESNSISAIVIGIGINVSTARGEFPKELEKKAESLIHVTERPLSRNRIAGVLINEVLWILKELGSEELIQEYKSRSIVLGKEIEVLYNQQSRKAMVLDIDERGGLLVEYENQEKQVLTSGEISIRGEF